MAATAPAWFEDSATDAGGVPPGLDVAVPLAPAPDGGAPVFLSLPDARGTAPMGPRSSSRASGTAALGSGSGGVDLASELAHNLLATTGHQASGFAARFTDAQRYRSWLDVPLRTVGARVAEAFVPTSKVDLPSDMYGPVVVVLLLATLAHLRLKISGASPRDGGTVVGSALALTVPCWIFGSLGLWGVAHLAGISVDLAQFMCLIGYSLCHACAALIAAMLVPSWWVGWAVICGSLASLRVAVTLRRQSQHSREAIVTFAVLLPVQIIYLLSVLWATRIRS